MYVVTLVECEMRFHVGRPPLSAAAMMVRKKRKRCPGVTMYVMFIIVINQTRKKKYTYI